MNPTHLLVAFSLFVYSVELKSIYDDTISIVKKNFEVKGVTLVTAFVCWGKAEHDLVVELAFSEIRINFIRDPELFAEILLQDKYFKVGVLVDMACDNVREALQKASFKKKFDIHKFWLILENGGLIPNDNVIAYGNTSYEVVYSVDNNIFPEGVLENEEIINITYNFTELGIGALSELRILEDSEVTWIQVYRGPDISKYIQILSNGGETTYDSPKKTVLLLDVYKTHIEHPLNVSVTGIAYVFDNGEEKYVSTVFAKRTTITRRRWNLHGAHFKTATVILYPEQFVDWYDLRLRHIDKWSKIHWPIYGFLTEQMNFTFDVNYQLDNYGWLINGSFDGMMGYMEREEVEFPSTGIFVRDDRFRVTDYCADTFPLRATTMFRQPSLSTVSNIFTLPFDTYVWISCLALCFTCIAALELQIKTTIKQNIEKDMIYSKLSDIITFVLGAICQQGSHVTPSSLAGRTTVFILTLSSLFLFTSYSANIVALLQTPSTSFKTIRDLTHSPMILGVENQTYNRVYMQETTDPELREFYLKKIAPQGDKAYRHASIGMAQIKQTMRAFQVDTTSAYKIMSETYEEYEKCGLMEIDLFPAPMFTIAVTKGSPLRDYFSQRVRWYREIGLMDHLFKMWMPQKAKCVSNAGGFVSVSLTEFYPAMMVLQYGMWAAFFILVVEKLYFYRSHFCTKILQKGTQQHQESQHPSVIKPDSIASEATKMKQKFKEQGNWLK